MTSLDVATESTDSPRDECGVLAISTPHGEGVAELTFFGLFALQHRGQEAAGIAVPAWLALAAYGPDALLLGLGLVVWLAYYGMVHFEPEFRGYARFTAMGCKVILLVALFQ